MNPGKDDNTNTYTSLYNYWGEHCNKDLKFNGNVISITETFILMTSAKEGKLGGEDMRISNASYEIV
jgi:hypothetical protein